jgi:hypothetical protein
MYEFIESRSDKGFTRLGLGNKDVMVEALSRFAQENPGKDPFKQDVLRVKLDAQTDALVFPKKGDSWTVTVLERPTARYHYKVISGTPWAHKVSKTESVVVDVESNGGVIARYTAFGRGPAWFFVGLGNLPYVCDAPGRWPLARGNPMIYRESLIPPRG